MRRAVLTVLLAACTAGGAPQGALAGGVAALDRLSGVRNPATGAPSVPGDRPERVRALAAWSVLAVAGAGEDPAAWVTGGRSLAGALGRRPAGPVLAASRWALAARAARRLTARDAAAVALTLTRAQDPSGRIGAGSLDTAWGLLALRVAGVPGRAPATAALAALRTAQLPDGGWTSGADPLPDTAATAGAVQALAAWGEPRDAPAMARARAWLLAAQRGDGSFPATPGEPGTGVDTAWAALGIWALGESPRARPWSRGRGPLGALQAWQRPDGGVPEGPRGRSATFATALAALAFAGRPLPVSTAPVGVVTRRAPRVVRREPAAGDAPGALVSVAYRDEPGGTGVDPASVRLVVRGVDLTRLARISRLSLEIDTSSLGPLPAGVELRFADQAGNRTVERWLLAARGGPGG